MCVPVQASMPPHPTSIPFHVCVPVQTQCITQKVPVHKFPLFWLKKRVRFIIKMWWDKEEAQIRLSREWSWSCDPLWPSSWRTTPGQHRARPCSGFCDLTWPPSWIFIRKGIIHQKGSGLSFLSPSASPPTTQTHTLQVDHQKLDVTIKKKKKNKNLGDLFNSLK